MRGEWFAARVMVGSSGTVEQRQPAVIMSGADITAAAKAEPSLRVIGPGQPIDARPHARGVAPLLRRILKGGPVDLNTWEPDYGRLPEAQVRLEARDGAARK